jgi:hypothetical protein
MIVSRSEWSLLADSRWYGEIDATPIVAKLIFNEGILKGSIVFREEIYSLQGICSDYEAEGFLTDQQGRILPLLVSFNNGKVFMLVYHPERNKLFFETQLNSPTQSTPARVAAPASALSDESLLGVWEYYNDSGSGFGGVVKRQAAFFDGGMLALSSSAIDRESQILQLEGRWKTTQLRWKTKLQKGSKPTLLIQKESGWKPYGRYYVEGAVLLFTRPDREKELWYSRNEIAYSDALIN